MRKYISTIAAVAIISTMSVNTASAGSRGIDPIWIPVAIFSTLAAVAITQPTVVEQRVTYEPGPSRVIVYEEPEHHRHVRHYERDRGYEVARYREREYRYQ